jgi:hypothetical protein
MKLFLAAVVFAAPALAAAPPANFIPHPDAPYWFKTYSTAPYKEIWTAELVVKNLDAVLPKLVAAVEKGGGTLTQPLETFVSSREEHSQQVAFSAPGKRAKGLIKVLRKFGRMDAPAVRPVGVPIPLDEVRAKIKVIMKEKTDHGVELAKVPAAAAAQEEILEHLLMVEEVAARADSEVRLNLTLRQK